MQMGSLRSSAVRSSAGSLRVDSDSDDDAAAAGGSLGGGTPGACSGRFGTQVACAYQQHRAFTGRNRELLLAKNAREASREKATLKQYCDTLEAGPGVARVP